MRFYLFPLVLLALFTLPACDVSSSETGEEEVIPIPATPKGSGSGAIDWSWIKTIPDDWQGPVLPGDDCEDTNDEEDTDDESEDDGDWRWHWDGATGPWWETVPLP